jgi:hypothetical protein
MSLSLSPNYRLHRRWRFNEGALYCHIFAKQLITDFNLFQSHLLSHHGNNTVEYTALTYNGHTQIHSQFSRPLHQYIT